MSEVPKEPAEFRLDHADRTSPTWARLKNHMAAQLEKLRRQNDNDADPLKTAKLRGRIAALKDLLALSEAPAMVADEEQAE